jgi:hypothetical protein
VQDFLAGGGEPGELVRSYRWVYTPMSWCGIWPIIGGKYPHAPGANIRGLVRDMARYRACAETAMRGDQGKLAERRLRIMRRHDFGEEAYYTFSCSPIPDAASSSGGITAGFFTYRGGAQRCPLGRAHLPDRRRNAPRAAVRRTDLAWPFGHGRGGRTGNCTGMRNSIRQLLAKLWHVETARELRR